MGSLNSEATGGRLLGFRETDMGGGGSRLVACRADSVKPSLPWPLDCAGQPGHLPMRATRVATASAWPWRGRLPAVRAHEQERTPTRRRSRLDRVWLGQEPDDDGRSAPATVVVGGD